MKPLPEIQPGMNESVLLSRFLRVMNALGVDNNRYVSWVGKRKIIRFTTFDEVHAENEKMNENEKKNENKEDLFFQPARQDFLCASQTHLHGSMSWIKSKLGTSPDPLIRQTLAVSADQGVDLSTVEWLQFTLPTGDTQFPQRYHSLSHPAWMYTSSL